MKDFNRWTYKLLPEFVSIVFAVTLALLLNEWRAQSAERKLVSRIIVTLRDETTENLQQLEQAYEYREALLREVEEGVHILQRIPISMLDFDPTNDQVLTENLKKSIVEGGRFEPKVEVLRIDDQRYLRLGSKVGRIDIRQDTLFVFGDYNIQLRSASPRSHAWELASATGALVNMDYEIIQKWSEIKVLTEDYRSTTEKALNLLYTGEGDVVAVMEDMLWQEGELARLSRELLDLLTDN